MSEATNIPVAPVVPVADSAPVKTERQIALQAYYDANTAEKKAAVVKQYPLLSQIFASVNHTLAILALLLFCASAQAGSTTLLGSMVNVNGVSNSPPVTVGTFTIPGGYFLISNGGLTATNALTATVQASIDGTNYVNVAGYTFPTTNATTAQVLPSYPVQYIYLRLQVAATNTLVGATFQQ